MIKVREKNSNGKIQLPHVQYLGNKEKFADWIISFIPKEVKVCMDAFSGTSVVGYALKKKGFKVISNDILKFNYYIAKAVIENNGIRISEEDIKLLFSENKGRRNFIEREFTDLFYTREECIFLDNLWHNIQKLDNEYKKAIIYASICRTLTRKILFGYFCHTKAMEYRNHSHRVYRNPSINQNIKELFLSLLEEYNRSVMDNNKQNEVYNENILNLIRQKKVDLVYFDPPYVGVHPDYHSFYHFLETYVDYMENVELRNGTKMSPKKRSGFTKKTEIIESFEKLFGRSRHIPYWIMSYNSRAFPDVETMTKLLKKYKEVRLEKFKYSQNVGGMGSRKGSEEYLFICSPKN